MAPTTDGDLLALQGNIKRDPESYAQDFALQYRHYQACLAVFNLKPSEDSKKFAELVMFLAQVCGCYPEDTQSFVPELIDLLNKHYAVLNGSLRQTIVKALIMIRNRNQISALELLPVFFTLFRCQDKTLRSMIFKHIISDVKQANKKGQNQQFNRAVQNYFYSVLEDAHEGAAKKSLAVLIELWQRQVWRDARTVNVIASAALHKSPKLMLAALKYFLGQDEKDPEDSDEEEDDVPKLANPTKAEVYKATKKGTNSSKKKKEKKLKRVMAAVKKQQRKVSKNFENFAAIQLLHDPQKFAEELFKKLNKSQGEKLETRMAMMNVISRVIGVHKLLLLNFYPFMQKYVLPHQRDAPKILAILVQAVHDEVPPDALQPVLRQLVDQFVHDRARPEVMTLGLKSVRSLCERAPLVISADLLQDLVMYKKFREKEVASAARSLITLFRDLAPGMLEKKDRGRDADLTAGPQAFGARVPMLRVQGADLLQQAELRGDVDSDEEADNMLDDDEEDNGSGRDSDGNELLESDLEDAEDLNDSDNEEEDVEDEAKASISSGAQDDDVELNTSDIDEENKDDGNLASESPAGHAIDDVRDGKQELEAGPTAKRKRVADSESLSSMKKRLTAANAAKKIETDGKINLTDQNTPIDDSIPLEYQRILTEEDFERIRELRHKKMVTSLMQKHGLKSAAKRERLLAAAEEEAEENLDAQDMRAAIGEDRIAPGALIGRHKTRQSKEDRLATVMEGREGRSFGAAASRKHQKVGGRSNKEKLKQKNLPMGAKKHIVHRRAGKQRVGKKNFKGHTKHLR